MRIRNLFIVLFVAIMTSGCSKYGYVSLNFPTAPQAYLPDSVNTIAAVNCSLTMEEEQDGKIIEAIATSEVAGSDRLASDECIKGVFDAINGMKDVELVIPGKVRMVGTGTRKLPELLDWDQVADICESEGADALLVLETFDSNTDLLLSTAKFRLLQLFQQGL